MGIDRREFIRIAGLSTLLGLGGTGAFELLAPGRVEAEIIPGPGSMKAKRWAMVINQKKLDDKTAQQCAAACHRVHNVPDFINPPDDKLKLNPAVAHRYEVKWLWTEHFHNAFPDCRSSSVLAGQCLLQHPGALRQRTSVPGFRRPD